MSNSVVAKRYASALFELAQQHGQTATIQEELNELKKAFRDNKGLEQLLSSPRLSVAKKREMIADIFKGVNPIVMNTLFVLLDAKRMNEAQNVFDEFHQLANDAAGVAEAKVYSTRPLTELETNSISTAFAHKVGKQSLRIENIIDPSLIGGIRLQIGNQIYDSSLSAKLEKLQRKLIGS
ncbi:F0F1 ATP synthase subunit delta [Sporosarcina highlanderae]|uniref:ATP synthase subunit delta n=1 Tax=Sporosarcina highlanderae TaxID=3035916 RepID=A0ABT8JLH5_9BACL|nr:F0F1 ATP synthase subunit delta [Sporosarcina highlanderae]MDN4605995.1 F0F1 ATP synthase subunit delta [Sporosarcina highlanderae]